MKKLGLVGGISWVSTVEYYKYINEGVNKRLGGLNYAECMIYSLNFADLHAVKWDKSYGLLLNACLCLQKSGAQGIVLCANTAHFVVKELAQALDIPIISLVSATLNAVKEQGLNKVALIGTKYTMEMDFYSKEFNTEGIELTIPNKQKTRDFIQNTLKSELGKGFIKEKTKSQYKTIINKLIKNGAQGIIYGCTELPLFFNEKDFELPVFDTTKIHAEAAVKFSIGEKS